MEQNLGPNIDELKAKTLITDSKLNPTSEEIALWKKIDEADLPIRTTLKRLNRILKKKFPKYKLQTVESCSGHIKEDGSIDRGLAYVPEILFYTRSKTHLSEMAFYLSTIFNWAVNRVNDKFKDDVIGIDKKVDEDFTTNQSYFNGDYYSLLPKGVSYRKFPNIATYAIMYEFPILRQQNAFPVLEQFWTNIEQELARIDGLDAHAPLRKDDFIRRMSIK